jgi:hypothetical protein
MFRSVLPDVLQFLPDHLTAHSLLCCSPAIRADMRNDIRLNGSDLTMALAKASHWERHAKNTHLLVEDGLRSMNRELEDARGVRAFGAERDSLNDIIISNGNMIYQSLFNSQQPDLFMEEEEMAVGVIVEGMACSDCRASPAIAGTEVHGALVCARCYLDEIGRRVARRARRARREQ